MLLLGGLYLIMRRVISPRIPAAFLGTVAVLTFLFPRDGTSLEWMTAQLCSGGLVLGAFFMATDYTTSPVTPRGQVLYGWAAASSPYCSGTMAPTPTGWAGLS